MRIDPLKKHWRALTQRVPELGERHVLCNWVHDGEPAAPMVDIYRYGELLKLLPDRIVENLEKARLARDGRIPMLKAGLGYEELLSSVIVDGTPVSSSSTEGFLFPALLLPFNYLQPGGIPGRTLRWTGRGRVTTLSTAGTLTTKFGAATTNATPTTTWAITGAVTMDAAVHTNEQWFSGGEIVVRSVGSGGTVFAQGFCENSAAAFTIANQTASFMGSAGAATPATASVDQTVPEYISLTGKWSLTTAYSITGHTFLVEALN